MTELYLLADIASPMAVPIARPVTVGVDHRDRLAASPRHGSDVRDARRATSRQSRITIADLHVW